VTSEATAVQEIEWSVAGDLIGDIGITHFDISEFRWLHRRTVCLNMGADAFADAHEVWWEVTA
jgi:hypothetical protein